MQRNQRESASLRIREATIVDIPAVSRIEEKSFPKPWGKNAFMFELVKSYSRFFVAEIEGRVVGYIVCWIFGDELYIANVAVELCQRGRGIGEALVLKAIECAKESGCKCVTLEVRKTNISALRLYKKLGFKVVGIRKGMYSDGEDGLVMEKLLY